MSFAQSYAEAKSCINKVEVTPSISTSPVREGSDSPGGAANGNKANTTHTVGRLRAGIKTPKTRTDKLTRKL